MRALWLAGAVLAAAAVAGALSARRASRCDPGYVETDWPGGGVTCALRAAP